MSCQINYFLDPLHAISARDHFYVYSGGCKVSTKHLTKEKYTNAVIERELKVSGGMILRAKLALFGESRKMNKQEFEQLKAYIIDRKKQPRKKNPYTIIALAHSLGMNRNTAISKSMKLLGKRCKYTPEEFEMLSNYLANVKIRRAARRVSK